MFSISIKYFEKWVALLCLLTTMSLPCWALQADDLRGKRFCEVILGKGRIFEVYNTIDLNDCPSEIWDKISELSLKKETGSSYAILNGPRRFIMDGVKNAAFITDTPREFQGLAMRKCAILHLSFRETLYGSLPYHEHHVLRKTTWVYNANSRVYELISPDGQVYVMQSYVQSAAVRSEHDLMTLEQNLKLPRGWIFKTGLLKQEQILVAIQEKAIIVQDDQKNTYQLAKHDFL